MFKEFRGSLRTTVALATTVSGLATGARRPTRPGARRACAAMGSVLRAAVTGVFVVAVADAQPAAMVTHAAQAERSRDSYFWRTIDADNGLPETSVSAIVQTGDGYYWLGTRRGVVRYDGARFTLFPPERERALGSGTVNALSTDRAGRLWISTNRGVATYEKGVFRRVDSTSVPYEPTWRVLQDRNGRYWVAGSFGVLVGDGRTFAPVAGADAFTYSLAEDSTGRIWMAGREFLGSIGPGEREVRRATFTKGERFFDVVSDRGNAIWVGTRTGAWRIDVSDPGHPTVLQKVAVGLPELGNEVWSLAKSANGDLWMGTESHGILRWNGSVLDTMATSGATIVDQVWMLYADARGRMWAGTAAGMLRFQTSPFTTLPDGLDPVSTWTVRKGSDGRLWAATSDGEVSWLDGETWRRVLPRAGRREATSLWPLPDGTMLAGYAAQRLLRVGVSGARDAGITIPGARIGGVYVDSDGSYWVTTDSGLYQARDGVPKRMNAALGLEPGDEPNIVIRDARGRLLIGNPGLTVVDGGRVTRYGAAQGLTDPAVRTLLRDEHDNLWLATTDSGLYVLRRGKVAHLGDVDPRLAREVSGLALDDLGFLWLSSSFGLLRVARAHLEAVADGRHPRGEAIPLRQFERVDGLPTTEFNSDFQNVIHKDRNGMLWFGTYLGVVRVDPSAIPVDTAPPQVHLERLVVDGGERALDAVVRLPGHVARVEITFAITDALVPARARVQYRMRGIDERWRDVEGRRTLSFGPLAGGSYRLEVRAASEAGEWNPRVASLALDVPLTPLERPWFVPMLVALSVGIVALGARWRQRRLVARGRELTALVDERTRDLEASRATLEQRVHERTAALQHELEERKRLEQRLVMAQKLESVGRLAGGVAHEINNSMSAVLGFAELAQAHAAGQSSLEEDLRDVVKAGRRVADITRQLLAFARRQQTERLPLQLTEVVRGLGRTLQQALEGRSQLVLDVACVARTVLADSSQLEQLLLNLVTNARDAMPDGGTVTVRVRDERLDAARTVGDTELPPGEYATIAIADTGTGMSELVRARLFEPFFTTKELHRGTGLGLAVVHGIVAAHQGAIDVQSVVGEGTTFVVWLPTVDAPLDAPLPMNELIGGSETILLVEDEPTVRTMVCRLLELQGYRVMTAMGGPEALRLAHEVGDAVDIVVTDVVMPHMSGLDLAVALRALRPGLPVVFMTGFAGGDMRRYEELAAVGTVVAKPFTSESMARAVRDALDTRPAMPVA